MVFGSRAGIAEGTLETLAVLYGLTPAERRVLRELAQERSPIQIAEVTGVSIRTVRSQLSSIFSKTGARSQRDLLALALGLPPFALA